MWRLGAPRSDVPWSSHEVARVLGTSERTLRTRVQRLQDSGLIRIVIMVDGSSDRHVLAAG